MRFFSGSLFGASLCYIMGSVVPIVRPWEVAALMILSIGVFLLSKEWA